jgi:hypothetical protein
MILAGTGHRPNKLGGYGPQAHDRRVALAVAALKRHAPARVISGMALGWDTALAIAAVRLEIPFVAAVPFEGQESAWPSLSQAEYRRLLDRAAEVVHVCPPGYAAAKMQTRNEWMVDRCDLLLALWDGSPGGTANCVEYATLRGPTVRRGVQVVNLWPSWAKYANLRTMYPNLK